MNQSSRSKVISIRLSAAEYSQLAADAEMQKQAVSGVLVTAWRKQNTMDGHNDRLAEISLRLEKIEASIRDIDAVAEWASAVNDSMKELRETSARRLARLEVILTAIAKAAGLEVKSGA